MKQTTILFMLALTFSFSPCWAQRVNGNLEGRVLDSNKNPLHAVNVIVSGQNIQGDRGAATDEQGNFRVLALPVGSVTVQISHVAHQGLKYENVPIRLGKTTTLGVIEMKAKPIELAEVVVTSERPIIDPNVTTYGANIATDEFEALPTERDFLSVTTLLPQANTSFLGDDVNIAGSTGQENAYFIDGMNTTDPFKANGGTELPYNFIKEIELKSGGYEAEFGRATGGIVNVITHSGSNEFHAKAFGFFTNNRFANESRRGFVELPTGDFSRYDAGLSLGGPAIHDKLWFFLAYNNKVEQEDIDFSGLGFRTDKNVANIFAGKLTWRATGNTNVVLSVFGDPGKRDRIGHNSPAPLSPSAISNPDVFLGKWEDGGVNFSLKASHVVNQNMLIEGSASRYNAHLIAEPATDRGRKEPLYIDNTTGIWSGGYGNAFDHHSIRNSASLAATYYHGNHNLKSGFQYEDNVFDEDWRWQSEGPQGAGLVIRNAPSFWVVLPVNFQTEVRNRVISAFAQASLAIHPRLRLNTGLRWDAQYWKGLDTELGFNITDQLQPRVGFVLQLGEMGTQKVTGSVGRFYEQVPSFPISLLFGNLYQDAYLYFVDPFVNPDSGMVIPLARPGEHTIDKNLRGEHFDEFTLGYERQVKDRFKFGIRGIYRTVRQIIQNADDPETGAAQVLTGNPGRGILSFLPKAKREYTALEITLEKFGGQRFNFLASYILSRNYGNYTGLFSSDTGLDLPNAGLAFDNPESVVNATGLLPNNRTHVFKFNGSYRFDFGLLVGTSFNWQSGTPLSELGHHPDPANLSRIFLKKRGSVGNTPAIWDLNFRLTYNLNQLIRSSFNQNLILDVFHLFSQRKAVLIEQQRYFAVDPETGDQITENPNYLAPMLYQLPTIVRLGLEVNF
jgi:hypothetical protein